MSGFGQEDRGVLKEWTLAERFRANVVWFRHQVGLTQQVLADRVGMNRVVLSKLEQGQRLPRLDTILKLVAGLEVGNCDLVAGMWWDPPVGFRVSPVGFESGERPRDQLRQRSEDPRHRGQGDGR